MGAATPTLMPTMPTWQRELYSKILRESPVHERLKAYSDEKRRIGAMAVSLIHDGETIILDSGTTTLEIARQMKKMQGLQVITNGVNIAAELLDARDVQVFIVEIG